MKKSIKQLMILAICLFIFYQNSTMVNAEEEPTEVLQDLRNIWFDTHYYPFYQRNEEWEEKYGVIIFSPEECHAFLNPPEDLLITMSSKELAKLMQEFPELGRLYIYLDEKSIPDFEWLFMYLEEECDIFYELLRREDGIKCLLEEYQNNVVDLVKIDYSIYEEENNDRWIAEMLGCHFIIHYAHHFTESEYVMASSILEEKSERYYTELRELELYTMSLEDLTIEPPSGEPIKKIRTNYLSEEEIQEKEEKLEAARIKLDEIKRQEELEWQKERAKEIRKFLVRCLIIGGTGIGVAGVVTGSVFLIRRRKKL